MRTTAPSTAPGSDIAKRALWDNRAAIIALNDSGLPWCREMAAAVLEAIDPRPYSQALDEGIRQALGADDPDAFGVISKCRRRVALVRGPASYLLPSVPSPESFSARINAMRAPESTPKPMTVGRQALHVSASTSHAAST